MDIRSRVEQALAAYPRRVVACSGGVDSLLLADLAHALAPTTTLVVHSVTPAVPEAATQRVRRVAAELGWSLRELTSAEFDDGRYLENPVDRCYFCKTNLYDEIDRVLAVTPGDSTVMSGANTDDLGEYRPGLEAAAEHRVRHPFVEAGLTKAEIRALAMDRRREWHDLPAAPCLASRLYTGTPVTPSVVRAVDRGETFLRQRLYDDRRRGVVRCRIDHTEVRVEVTEADRERLDDALLADVLEEMRSAAPQLSGIRADAEPYRPGRAFVGVPVHHPDVITPGRDSPQP